MKALKYISAILALICIGSQINISAIEEAKSFKEKTRLNTHQVGFIKRQAKSAQQPVRTYETPVSPSEKKDIAYIVNTLAMKSIITIVGSKSSLEKAGQRVDHVHPLRFLMTVFTDEEMKASAQALKDRGWVWGEFFDGLKDSLETESSRDNIKLEYINDFARQVGIRPDLIIPSIQNRQWKQFIFTLINSIPRNTNANRYDT